MIPTTVLVIEKNEMIRALHEEYEFSDRFITYLLVRKIRVEAGLIDQLFNSSEKRMARPATARSLWGPGSTSKSAS
jgi:CRP/FNR family cyclic AMP-dependent transcriptional regulator